MKPVDFAVAVSDQELRDLRRRLSTTRWSPEVANDDWAYGTSGRYLGELVNYWLDGFDWRAQEAAINRFSHFRIELGGIPVHYVHARGKGPNPLPVVLTHGWPWTFWDWAETIGPLVDPAAYGGDPADSFDVVVPSLPGYTFSNPLTAAGVTVPVIAGLWDTLLRTVLGYDRYGAAGGDWGAAVTMALGTRFAAAVTGIYLSTPPIQLAGGIDNLRDEDYAPDEAGWLAHTRQKWATTKSHVTVHGAEPQSLAWALNDSPAGLAAWLVQRRRDWSDCKGDVENAFSKDFLLTTTSLYWFTNCIGPSIRLYADTFGATGVRGAPAPARIEVPTGIGVFPEEVARLPRRTCERVTNLVHWSVLGRGGHFAPAEQPELYVDELRSFFRPLR